MQIMLKLFLLSFFTLQSLYSSDHSLPFSGYTNDSDRLREHVGTHGAIITKDNIDKVIGQREPKITDIQDKSDVLRDGVARLQATSENLKRRMWIKNLKSILFLGCIPCCLCCCVEPCVDAVARNCSGNNN